MDNPRDKNNISGEDGDDEQTKLRKEILSVQRDETLTAQEKAQRIQKLMMRNYNKSKREENKQDLSEIRAPTYYDKEKNIFGCKHYMRSCKMKAACCKKWVVCRLCHDETSDHQINRYATKKMVCMICGEIQPIGSECKSSTCKGRRLTKYYCEVCKFHDDDPNKNIYHCPDCNICRIGLSTEARNHKCIENSLGSDCPICHVYMFTSRDPVIFMRCGHAIHNACFSSYVQTNFTCPICHKSILDDLSGWIRRMDFLISVSQMPEEYAESKATVFCNDCEQRSTVPYHYVGHKCQNEKCGSYNTTIIATHDMPTFPLRPSANTSANTTESNPGQASNHGALMALLDAALDDVEDIDEDEEEEEEEEEEILSEDEGEGEASAEEEEN